MKTIDNIIAERIISGEFKIVNSFIMLGNRNYEIEFDGIDCQVILGKIRAQVFVSIRKTTKEKIKELYEAGKNAEPMKENIFESWYLHSFRESGMCQLKLSEEQLAKISKAISTKGE